MAERGGGMTNSIESPLVRTLLWQLKGAKVETPTKELRFAPPRRWRFDLAWPDRMVAVEVEGGTWTNGRHVRGSGFEKDAEKYSEAAIRGWKVIRVTRGMIERGDALSLIERAMRIESATKEK